MHNGPKIYVAGHRGMVGSAITRRLLEEENAHVITRSHDELSLDDAAAVEEFFAAERPDVVVLAAAKVGGIIANATLGADFIRENLMIQTNVIDSAYRNGTQKFMFLGSSCIYPKYAEQPITEEALLTGPLEETNRPYAIAKIAGITMCDAYARQYGFKRVRGDAVERVRDRGQLSSGIFSRCRRPDAPVPRGETVGSAEGCRVGERIAPARTRRRR